MTTSQQERRSQWLMLVLLLLLLSGMSIISSLSTLGKFSNYNLMHEEIMNLALSVLPAGDASQTSSHTLLLDALSTKIIRVPIDEHTVATVPVSSLATATETSEIRKIRKPHVFPSNVTQAILPKILALYFPQYHKSPLNDRLWGDNFTDWVNLNDAPATNRKGFRIMRPTSKFGYYDLTNKTIRMMQSTLARKYGVDGFVYHHYWFYDDKYPGPSLHAPLMKMLDDGYPDLPFCLHWVNEKWTATWHRARENITTTGRNMATITVDAASKEILQEQFFPTQTSKIAEHYKWLSQFFHHDNYIKVDGKPVFMVYGPAPGSHHIIATLKQMAIDDGFPGLHCTLGQYASPDALLEAGRGRGKHETLEGANAVFDRLTNYPYPYDWTRRESLRVPAWCMAKRQFGEQRSNDIIGIVTSFDNTPRRQFNNSRLWVNKGGEKDTLRKFGRNLWAAMYYQSCCHAEGGKDQFILINAWNEWAEGMAMEPSDVYQVKFLENLQETKKRFETCASAFFPSRGV